MTEHERIQALDKNYVWHPFTQMKAWLQEEQLIIAEGEANYLIDTQGKRYLDGVSSLWCNIFGHRRPEIDNRIKEQLAKIAHSTQLGCGSIPAAELAQKIVQASPEGIAKVFYSDSGSEAAEIAIKMAYQYCRQNGKPQRNKLISISEAYHGDTIGSVSVGGIDLFHATFRDLLFDSIKIPTPYCYRCPFGQDKETCDKACFSKAEEVFAESGASACGLVTEPIFQGAAGMIEYPDGFLAHLRKLCSQYGVFMIVDEVAAGFGRTGTMWACQQEDVHPDIMCIAKGLTGGYLPVAATAVTQEVFEGFLGEYTDYRTFYHGHTYTGNQLGCAAGLGTFEIFEQEDVLGRVQQASQRLRSGLAGLDDHPHVGEIRLRGLMGGIELVADRASKAPFDAADLIGARVCKAAREYGVLIRPLGDTVILMPQLSITDEEIDILTDSICKSIDSIVRN